ncbi:hypothetical protein [Couchioplanes caeruleus]|uniref:Uncharacterized protein n=2 Tax=Couchioplanes caeruleus TaxID=56438 RepID=A0A1K0FRI6_9ACTN|nr:hypothetical protein [Couchioplanes caeruleus]OJF15401.1 hypothetical protein BG844_04685 [Couchioplanes caeruleus subsp. caeruleus]ROP33442.1 hypothetical protein EDD30_6424 [Couchioplanes caeruleus]
MASWILVPCLVSLRNEVNRLAPSRRKDSDGSIGDTSHAAGASDHNPDETGNTPTKDSDRINEVHALDVDKDLRKAGWNMARVVQVIVTRHRQGRDDRLDYVIWDRRIWARSWGWTARAYNGDNPHTGHAHFSARYNTAQESNTRPWGLLEEDDDVTKTEFTAWMTEWARSSAGRDALATAVLAYDPGKDAAGKVSAAAVVNPDDDAASNPTVRPAWALYRAIVASNVGQDIRGRVDRLQASVDSLLQRNTPSAPPS